MFYTYVRFFSSSESLAASESDEKEAAKPVKLTTAERKALAQKSIFSDSDSESGTKRPRSPMVRTKAAMKEFSVDALPRGQKSQQPQKQPPATKKTPALSASSSSSRYIHAAKFPKRPIFLTVRFFFSSESESDSETLASKKRPSASAAKNKSKTTSASKTGDSDFYPLIVPERAAARKATAMLKDDGVPKKPKVTPLAAAAASNLNNESSNSSSPTTKETTKEKKSSKKHHKRPPKSRSTSPESMEEVNIFADVTPDLSGYVPQRKAALKATTQMKDADKYVFFYDTIFFSFREPHF